MFELFINTDDSNFFRELQSAKIPGLKISIRGQAMDSIDAPIISTASTIIVSTFGTVALNVFSSWLYDRLKKDKSHITTINQQNITNNIGQINIIINELAKNKQETKNK